MEESCWPYSWVFYYHRMNPLLTQTFFKGAKTLSIISIALRASAEHLVQSSVMQMFTWLALKKEADRFIKRQADTQIPLWKIHHKFFLSARLLWWLSWTFQFRLWPCLSHFESYWEPPSHARLLQSSTGQGMVEEQQGGRHPGAWCPVSTLYSNLPGITPFTMSCH